MAPDSTPAQAQSSSEGANTNHFHNASKLSTFHGIFVKYYCVITFEGKTGEESVWGLDSMAQSQAPGSQGEFSSK